MRIVVDTSVLVAATLRDGRVRHLYLAFLEAEWVVPQVALKEAERHLPRIAVLSKRSVEETREALEILLDRAALVDLTPSDVEFTLAEELIGGRDPSDTAFVAACLKSGALGVWSLDDDFDGIEGVPRFTTAGVSRLLDLVGRGPAEEGRGDEG